MKRKICVVTGSRSEYGLFYPILRRIQASKYLELQLVATTMHLSNEFGLTYRKIEADGFNIDEKIENLLSSNGKTAIAKSTGMATILLSDSFVRLQPDIVLLLGDRFETHAAATTAMLMHIPIAHIHGGEVTEGAIDDQIRHSITKMASLHFTSTEEYRNRVIQLGESPETVFCTGAPGIDNILDMKLFDKENLEKKIRWKINKPTALFTFHSETLSSIDITVQIEKVLQEIRNSDVNVLFTYANADNGGTIINNAIEHFAAQNKGQCRVIKSLGQLKYLSAMKYTDFLIGNSSSGIIEAASFHKPVINIGNRQKGRLQSGNVIDCNINTVERAIKRALTTDFIKQCNKIVNVYGNGQASTQIVQLLEQSDLEYIKRFYDL